MSIKIIKKRQAGDVRKPADLVEQPAEPAPVQPPAQPIAHVAKREVTVCTFCNHAYIIPCHGESDKCMNRRFIERRQAQQGN